MSKNIKGYIPVGKKRIQIEGLPKEAMKVLADWYSYEYHRKFLADKKGLKKLEQILVHFNLFDEKIIANNVKTVNYANQHYGKKVIDNTDYDDIFYFESQDKNKKPVIIYFIQSHFLNVDTMITVVEDNSIKTFSFKSNNLGKLFFGKDINQELREIYNKRFAEQNPPRVEIGANLKTPSLDGSTNLEKSSILEDEVKKKSKKCDYK